MLCCVALPCVVVCCVVLPCVVAPPKLCGAPPPPPRGAGGVSVVSHGNDVSCFLCAVAMLRITIKVSYEWSQTLICTQLTMLLAWGRGSNHSELLAWRCAGVGSSLCVGVLLSVFSSGSSPGRAMSGRSVSTKRDVCVRHASVWEH